MKIENKNESRDNCKLFNQAEKLKPKFANTRTAINFYTGRLEEISASNNCTIKELINRAEKNHEDDFFSDVLSLSRKIQFLNNRTDG